MSPKNGRNSPAGWAPGRGGPGPGGRGGSVLGLGLGGARVESQPRPGFASRRPARGPCGGMRTRRARSATVYGARFAAAPCGRPARRVSAPPDHGAPSNPPDFRPPGLVSRAGPPRVSAPPPSCAGTRTALCGRHARARVRSPNHVLGRAPRCASGARACPGAPPPRPCQSGPTGLADCLPGVFRPPALRAQRGQDRAPGGLTAGAGIRRREPEGSTAETGPALQSSTQRVSLAKGAGQVTQDPSLPRGTGCLSRPVPQNSEIKGLSHNQWNLDFD